MYIYTENNLFIKPNTYMYTKFHGLDFLKAYIENRRSFISFIAQNKETESTESVEELNATYKKLLEMKNLIEDGSDSEAISRFEPYLRRFEVAKRLRNSYPVKNQMDLASIKTHILFYEIAIEIYFLSNDLRYLNLILKLGDMLISIKDRIKLGCYAEQLEQAFKKEENIVLELLKKAKKT